MAGSVWALGSRYDSSALAVPEVSLFVATTFSPCPPPPRWKHRLRRSPHDRGQWGNLRRRTPLTRGGLGDLPGRGCGASDQDAVRHSLASPVLAPALRQGPPYPKFYSHLVVAPSVVPYTLIPSLPPGSRDDALRLAPSPSGTRRPGRCPAVALHRPPGATKPPGACGPRPRSPASAGGHSRAQSAPATTDAGGCRVASVTSPRPTRP